MTSPCLPMRAIAQLVRAEGEGEYQMTSKQWDDPQLDAAQFAIDRFLSAQQNVSEHMSELYQSIRDGSATDEDGKKLKCLRGQAGLVPIHGSAVPVARCNDR